MDLNPQYSGDELLIHYASPVITRQNTVIMPVKTGAIDGFRIEARQGSDGVLKWRLDSDYALPPHNWTPLYSIALTPKDRVCCPGAGGTLCYIDNPDTTSQRSGPDGRLVFYGMANYQASPAVFSAGVKINTAITSDRYGNLFFGFLVSGSVMLPGNIPLHSGIARVAEDGTGSWVAADVAAGDAGIVELVCNQSPALSNDHKTLYFAVSASDATGYLLAVDSRTLATTGKVRLRDVLNPSSDGRLMDDGTASPLVGPDGDVYFGVFENSWGSNHFRGWLNHYDKTLTQRKTPGAFGWDQTPSVVPSKLISSYHGSSDYLILSKYNNYAQVGGDGVNKVAVLDPNDSMVDPISGATVMKEVLTMAGLTPDEPYLGSQPQAVKEWCVNSMAVDPFTRSAIVNSEDGRVYRWDFNTNSLIEPLTITTGLGQAYTPTIIGVDGTVYAIGNGTLFAIGEAAP
ncbi:MAG: hypothetical protein JWO94_2528 [Verrucomicrobiaceae bacterium]|nr:hypothetical protein [Verrucomicrobiaceae bacterium]